MLDAAVGERTRIVFGVVKSNDFRHIQVLENVYIAAGGVPIGLLLARNSVHRAHKSEELARNDPVEVTILDLLVVLILFDIELGEVVPLLLERKLETLQTVLHSALIETLTLACVTVAAEEWRIRSQQLHNLIGIFFKNDEHECSHEEGRIGHVHSVVCGLCKVVNFSCTRILLRV